MGMVFVFWGEKKSQTKEEFIKKLNDKKESKEKA